MLKKIGYEQDIHLELSLAMFYFPENPDNKVEKLNQILSILPDFGFSEEILIFEESGSVFWLIVGAASAIAATACLQTIAKEVTSDILKKIKEYVGKKPALIQTTLDDEAKEAVNKQEYKRTALEDLAERIALKTIADGKRLQFAMLRVGKDLGAETLLVDSSSEGERVLHKSYPDMRVINVDKELDVLIQAPVFRKELLLDNIQSVEIDNRSRGSLFKKEE